MSKVQSLLLYKCTQQRIRLMPLVYAQMEALSLIPLARFCTPPPSCRNNVYIEVLHNYGINLINEVQAV